MKIIVLIAIVIVMVWIAEQLSPICKRWIKNRTDKRAINRIMSSQLKQDWGYGNEAKYQEMKRLWREQNG